MYNSNYKNNLSLEYSFRFTLHPRPQKLNRSLQKKTKKANAKQV